MHNREHRKCRVEVNEPVPIQMPKQDIGVILVPIPNQIIGQWERHRGKRWVGSAQVLMAVENLFLLQLRVDIPVLRTQWLKSSVAEEKGLCLHLEGPMVVRCIYLTLSSFEGLKTWIRRNVDRENVGVAYHWQAQIRSISVRLRYLGKVS
jgi:hypothetical protein